MHHMAIELTIGKLAQRAQVNVQTIRYYERRRLLPEPERTASNYRVYAEDTVLRVRFIKRAQDLGFTLNEIKELLELRASPRSCCKDVRARSEAKIHDIDEKVRSLEAMRKALSKLVSACSGQGPVTDCPILETLEGEA
jgi:Hg(II)-responsive transcriptional regulator